MPRMQPTRITKPCDDAVRADSGHAGEIAVWVDASDGHASYQFIGTGPDVQAAVEDAEEHAFGYLGEDASIGDWHAA